MTFTINDTINSTPEVDDLNAGVLRGAAHVLDQHAPVVGVLLDEFDTYFALTARHLIRLAELKEDADAEKLAELKAVLAAEDARIARVEAQIQLVAANLGRVGSRRNQAIKLLEKFDITLKD